MSCLDESERLIRRHATELRERAASYGVMRTVDATKAADWLNRVADALILACRGKEGEASGSTDVRWIPVEERQPPDDGIYMRAIGVHVHGKFSRWDIEVGHHEAGEFILTCGDVSGWAVDCIDFWAPVPVPAKVKAGS